MKRFLSILLVLVAAAAVSVAARGFPAVTRPHRGTADLMVPSRQPKGVPRRVTATCHSVIEYSAEPDAGGKVLFDRLSVPSDDRVLASTRNPWTRPFHYVTKYGFQIKAGRGPVEIRVSPTWHSRMTVGGASSIRFLGCAVPARRPWLRYASLYTVKKPACVSLIATVGGQSTRFRVPLGRPCPPPAVSP
jgi:hypothetical protein